MQAISVVSKKCLYTSGMIARRKKDDPIERPDVGNRLYEARTNAGLSQTKTAELIGVPQQTYAGWELKECAINPIYLSRLAKIFGVPLDVLIDGPHKNPRRGGLKGKAQILFEEVCSLPRSKQNKILSVVEDLIAANKD